MLSTVLLPSSDNAVNRLDHPTPSPGISNRFKCEVASNSPQEFIDPAASDEEERGNLVDSMDSGKEPTQLDSAMHSHQFRTLQEGAAKILESSKSDQWNLMKVRVGFDVTRKGERSLVIDGYKFTKSRDGMSDRVFWRCSRRECKATAVTVAGRVEHVRTLHTHKPPTAGEFFVEHHGAGGETQRQGQLQTVRFNDASPAVHGVSRSRVRRSHQPKGDADSIPPVLAAAPSQPVLPDKKARFYSDDSNFNAKAAAAILSNIAGRSVVSEDGQQRSFPSNDGLHESTNCQNNSFQNDDLQTTYSGGNTDYFHTAPVNGFLQSPYRPTSGFGARFSALSSLSQFRHTNNNVAQETQAKRDSQNSTPDPPFEVPVSSPPPALLPSMQRLYNPAPNLIPISPPLDSHLISSQKQQQFHDPIIQRFRTLNSAASFGLVRKNCLGQIVLLSSDQLAGLLAPVGQQQQQQQRQVQQRLPPAGFNLDMAYTDSSGNDSTSVQRVANGDVLVNSSLSRPHNIGGGGQYARSHLPPYSSLGPSLDESDGFRVNTNQLQTKCIDSIHKKSFEPAATTTDPSFVGFITTTNNGNTLLHWKKEKMRESEASEQKNNNTASGLSLSHQEDEEQCRPHFSGCSHFESPPAADAPPRTISNTTAFLAGARRKRCVSACQSGSNGPLFNNLIPNSFDPLTMVHANHLGSGGLSEMVEGGYTSPLHSQQQHQVVNEWCTQVQDDLLAKVLNTVQQLTAKLDADADPPELVIQNCKAIQACLETLHALKRTRACSSPQSDVTGLIPQKSPTNSPNPSSSKF